MDGKGIKIALSKIEQNSGTHIAHLFYGPPQSSSLSPANQMNNNIYI